MNLYRISILIISLSFSNGAFAALLVVNDVTNCLIAATNLTDFQLNISMTGGSFVIVEKRPDTYVSSDFNIYSESGSFKVDGGSCKSSPGNQNGYHELARKLSLIDYKSLSPQQKSMLAVCIKPGAELGKEFEPIQKAINGIIRQGKQQQRNPTPSGDTGVGAPPPVNE